MDLVTIVIISLLLVPLTILTSGILKILLGVALVIFFPGYTLMASLFPRKGDLGGVERLALSFGLSFAVVPLIGLALNFTWGISIYPVLTSILLFIAITAAVAWYRRQRLPPDERFAPRFRFRLSLLAQSWASQGQWDKILTILLAVVILAAIGTVGYIISKPKVEERFTEFYILGPQGKAENYPMELIPGAKRSVILAVVNQEHEITEYKIVVTMDEEKVTEVGSITLNHGEKWEQEVSFAPVKVGLNQKVEFLLYKGDATEVYRTLHL